MSLNQKKKFPENFGDSNYLYKKQYMYKNFTLTESEREQILNMHKEHGYGQPINEQDLVRLVNRVINEQTNVDESNFSQFIKTPNKLVIVDMTAEWCSPCQKMKKHFDEITADPKLNNKIVLGTYNFDFEKPLAKKYKVQGIPYVMFFRNGKLIYKFLGYKDKSYIISLIQKL